MNAETRAGDEFLPNALGQAVDDGDLQRQPGRFRRTGVPPRPQQRKPEPEGQCVAHLGGGFPAVANDARAEIGDHHDAAAVVDLIDQSPIAERRIGRRQENEIGFVFDQTGRVARRHAQQRDAIVAGMRRIERPRRGAFHPLIRPGGPKRGSAGQRRSRFDFDARDHRDAPRISVASVRSCNASNVSPSTMSTTTNPAGVTSSTAKSV